MHAALLSVSLLAGSHDAEAAVALALARARIRPERLGRLVDMGPDGRRLTVAGEDGASPTPYRADGATRWFVLGRETTLHGFQLTIFDERGNRRRESEQVRLVLYLLDPGRCAEVHLLPPHGSVGGETPPRPPASVGGETPPRPRASVGGETPPRPPGRLPPIRRAAPPGMIHPVPMFFPPGFGGFAGGGC